MFSIFKNIARAALLMGVLCAVVCCTKENTVSEESFTPNFKLSFAVPRETKADANMNYSDPMNQEGADNLLKSDDLEIYFFTTGGSYVTSVKDILHLRLREDLTAPESDRYHIYNVEMQVDDIVNGGVYRIVVLANRRSHLSGSYPFCTPKWDNWLLNGVGLTDEQKLYSTLQFNFSSTGTTGLSNYVARNFVKDEMAYVPMWGIKEVVARTVINEAGFDANIPLSGTIDMMRAVAKVKVQISSELLEYVNLTDLSVHTPVRTGYMTPAYGKVSEAATTPDILNKDRIGGSPTGAFTNDWINRGLISDSDSIYPLLELSGAYYIYLPEAYIGQCWMNLEFRWKDPAFVTPVSHEYKLHFADYDQAMAYYGLPTGVALSEEQLENFKSPVMRNHYYIYTIIGLNPMELKYEVCEWQYRSTDIEFN